jgi:hypothetical protein
MRFGERYRRGQRQRAIHPLDQHGEPAVVNDGDGDSSPYLLSGR